MAKRQTPADKPADSANATTDTQRTAPENPEPSTAPSDANVEEGEAGPPQDNPPTDLPPKLGQETVEEVVQPLTTPEVDTKGDSETSQDALNKQVEQDEPADKKSENTAGWKAVSDSVPQKSSNPSPKDHSWIDDEIINPDQLQAKAAGQQLTGDTMNERIERAKEIGWKNLDRDSQTSLMNELFDDADTLKQQQLAGELHRAQTFADMWQDTADMLANKMLDTK